MAGGRWSGRRRRRRPPRRVPPSFLRPLALPPSAALLRPHTQSAAPDGSLSIAEVVSVFTSQRQATAAKKRMTRLAAVLGGVLLVMLAANAGLTYAGAAARRGAPWGLGAGLREHRRGSGRVRARAPPRAARGAASACASRRRPCAAPRTPSPPRSGGAEPGHVDEQRGRDDGQGGPRHAGPDRNLHGYSRRAGVAWGD